VAGAEAIADELFDLLDSGRQRASDAGDDPDFDLAAAYRVTAALRARREAAGDRVAGRKIGFTNRTIWQEYQVFAPIWGHVWASTLFDLATVPQPLSLGPYAEPRIEPEIVFGLRRSPEPGMSVDRIAECIAWVAHGFEIVQSVFPGWRFTPADTVAAYGLHGGLFVGPKHEMTGAQAGALEGFEIDLFRDGEPVDTGRAVNVLDGPLHALAHLVEVLAADSGNAGLEPGEVVTTGTVTRAFPIAAGETWSTRVRGIGLEGATLSFG
jgi:2-oxo-3-hexenedioate decarboxylase